MADERQPALLIISGLDPSGGAGFIADVRLAARYGCRPIGVVTGLTVQDTRGVRAVELVSPDFLREQLTTLLSDIEVAAVKIGMLGSPEIADAVIEGLKLCRGPVVWDPVLSPTDGTVPLYSGALAAAADKLTKYIDVMTPNLEEAAHLSGMKITDATSAGKAALALAKQYGTAVLITGGHLEGPAVDVLAHRGDITEVVGQRVKAGTSVHGTGCALTTIMAAALAHGRTLVEAAVDAASRVRKLLAEAPEPGRGAPAVV
jgi:hydroxymethylpyrimidine/phosphomethylpyrimidine kinase